MKLKHGEIYTTRCGKVVGPLEGRSSFEKRRAFGAYDFIWEDAETGTLHAWTSHGRYRYFEDEPDPLDIVAQVNQEGKK